MRLKDQLTLPTVNDAIAVRPLSLPVPPGTTERRNLRTERSKTFAHAEKAPDGKEIRTCKAQIGAVCYRDDTGELRSIDTTIRDLGTHVGVEWAPYKFKLHETGIGFDFESREGGQCSVTLVGIGGEKFEDSIKPEVSDNTITYRDVRPGCDIVFKCLNERVKTLRILRDNKAPRTFDWQVESDKPELIDSTLTGTDAAGNQLELSSAVEGSVIRETWSGTTDNGEPAYPVEIDPSVTVNPGVDNDDGYQSGPSAFNNWTIFLGQSDGGFEFHIGVRFPSINIAQGSTPTEALFGLYADAVYGAGGAGVIYGRAADNAGQFGTGSDLPSAVDRTTASTTVTAVATTGAKTWDVTAIVAELLGRGGWVANNAMALLALTSTVVAGNRTNFRDSSSGSNIPTLSITYTAAAGGTARNLLLLGCG